MWTQLEIAIGAVSRLKSFSESVRPESLPCESEVPPVCWPQFGAIEIDNISASYEYAPVVSRNLQALMLI